MTLLRSTIAVTAIAALATAVGLGGMRHYSDDDIREAFELLPSQGLLSGLLVVTEFAYELLGRPRFHAAAEPPEKGMGTVLNFCFVVVSKKTL